MADTTSPIPAQTDARPMGILDEPNEDRALMVSLNGDVYARHPVRTHLVTEADDAATVVARYAQPLGQDVALVAVSERMDRCHSSRVKGATAPTLTAGAGPAGV